MWNVLISAGVSLFTWAWPRLLALVGLVAVTTGVYQPLINFLQAKINASLQGAGAASEFLQYVGVLDAVNVIMAAMTLKIGLRAAKVAYTKKVGSDA